jgi:hypothetical protein
MRAAAQIFLDFWFAWTLRERPEKMAEKMIANSSRIAQEPLRNHSGIVQVSLRNRS